LSRLSRQRPQARALTASGRKLDKDGTAYQRRLQQPWQLRSLGYYDTIGEINFTSKFLARQISRVRFYPARRLPDGSHEPIESGPPVEILNQIQDPGGGTSQIQFDYGRLMFITGEGVLFAYEEGTRWRFLWKDEVRQRPDGSGLWDRINYESAPTGDVGQAYRIWSPHPRWTDLADAPMRAVQDICEELLLLTLAVMSTAKTRMTKGVLWVPQEFDFAPLTDGISEDPEQSVFMANMMEHFANQIENPGSAEAAVPFVGQVPGDWIKTAEWMKLHDPATDYMEKELRLEAIRRLALSLDMSPEDLLGYTDANHWTARSVQLDRWRMFGYNKAELWGNAISEAYLRPALEAEGYPDWQDVIVPFDDSQVVISPDRTEDALKAHNDGLINGKAAREALGWKESDQMEGEEKEEWFALKLRQIPESMADDFMLPARGPMPSNGNGNGNGNAADGPPEPGVNTGVSRQESRTASARVLGAAELALLRCRELAGVRLRFKCPDCADGHPDSMVAAALGEKAAPDAAKLVKGATDGFQELLVAQGIATEHASALGLQLETFAARTLYQPTCPDLPSGFVAAVNKAQEVSSALAH
jgi:hypothetical protein